MIQRFLLDRIDAKSARSTVCKQFDFTSFDAAHEAKTALAFVHFARTRTDVALDATLINNMPMACGVRHMSGKLRVETANTRA